jgi:hypothetical protein
MNRRHPQASKSGKTPRFTVGNAQTDVGALPGKSLTGLVLLPIVLCDALVDHRLETGVLLDEDLAECPVLPQKNGLKAY